MRWDAWLHSKPEEEEEEEEAEKEETHIGTWPVLIHLE